MSKIRIAAALGLAALVATLGRAPVVQAQANCDWYAKTALKQQQENEQRKCGLSGADWSSDLKAHMTWCASVAPDAWKAAAQKRDKALAACVKKP